MKLTCADCGFEFEEAIVRDGLGWNRDLPEVRAVLRCGYPEGAGRDDVRG